jgi:Cfr10I/Bse634I restriction endonuclease
MELPPELRCVEDRRMSPVRNRDTQFRLLQQNMLAYTFDSFVPGFSTSAVLNDTPFAQIVQKPIDNANDEGTLLFKADYTVAANARAKVAGDIFEVVTHAVLWNMAARWNAYMAGSPWNTTPRYGRPATRPDPARQIAVLNLPRGYDWVRLLDPAAQQGIEAIRLNLNERHGLALPTSTPDIAVVVLPDQERANPTWRTELPNLRIAHQSILRTAYHGLEGKIKPGDLIFAVAVKRSLRSDRLYQPLYEANVMQLLLEGFLGAPRVEFEVHTLSVEGTAAAEIYRAASLYAVAVEQQSLVQGFEIDPEAVSAIHRAVRDLYIPATARNLAQRLLDFLQNRLAAV